MSVGDKQTKFQKFSHFQVCGLEQAVLAVFGKKVMIPSASMVVED